MPYQESVDLIIHKILLPTMSAQAQFWFYLHHSMMRWLGKL